MPDILIYSCYSQHLVGKLCSSCFNGGGDFFLLYNNSYCCAQDIRDVDGGIIYVLGNVTECGPASWETQANGPGVNYLDKFRIVSFALGPIIVGLLLILGWCTWKMTTRRQRIRTAIEIDGLCRYREMELVSLVPTLSATNTEIQGQVNRNPELIATTRLMEFDGNLDASTIKTCGGTLKCTRSAGEEGRIIFNPLYDKCAAGQEIPTLACSPAVLERVAGASINHVRLSDQKHSDRENCFAFTQATGNDGFSWVFNGHTDEKTGNDCYPQREEQEEEGTIEKRDEFKNCLQIRLSENLNEPNYLCIWESTTEFL